MLSKVREMMQVLPAHMAAVVRFACITGLRPTEVCESVRLLTCPGPRRPISYYNPEQQCLEHFRFPDIFLRTTKKAYISYITKESLSGIGISDCLSPTPTLNAITHACSRRRIPCSMHLTRKIFASWLHKSGIPDITIDMLQGRVPKSVLAQHYVRPDATLRQRVLDAVSQLEKEIK